VKCNQNPITVSLLYFIWSEDEDEGKEEKEVKEVKKEAKGVKGPSNGY
jgi:hypothetical protein